jgi:cadmium resistance protein CadD (predicted permease)
LVPIIIGLKVLFEKEDEDKEIIESTNRFRRLFLSVALLSIAAGGDNLGILKQGYTRSIVMTL